MRAGSFRRSFALIRLGRPVGFRVEVRVSVQRLFSKRSTCEPSARSDLKERPRIQVFVRSDSCTFFLSAGEILVLHLINPPCVTAVKLFPTTRFFRRIIVKPATVDN